MRTSIQILGSFFGSRLGTELASAGHYVTSIHRQATEAPINESGTEVRFMQKDEETRRAAHWRNMPDLIDKPVQPIGTGLGVPIGSAEQTAATVDACPSANTESAAT